MNASQRLFDRFDKAGPSWLPIIIMSLIGLSATIVSVYATTQSLMSADSRIVGQAFLLARTTGKSTVLLHQFTKADGAGEQDPESRLVRGIDGRNPGLTFLGALDAHPAFAPKSDFDPGQPMELGLPLNRRHYCWIDDRQSTILIGLFDWEQIQPRETNDDYGPGEPLPLSTVIAISRGGLADQSFQSTHARSSLPDLGDQENVLKLSIGQAGTVAELLKAHRSFVGQSSLETIDPNDFEVVVSSFFQQRAYQFANTGGISLDEGVTKMINRMETSMVSVADETGLASIVMGNRNGVSKQFDQFVLEKMSRDASIPEDIQSSSPPIVVQPLSCPIRMQSILRQLDGEVVNPLKTGGVLSPDSILDLPADLAGQIDSFQDSGLDIRDTAMRFNEVFNDRPDLRTVYQMKEPFPATVYFIKEQP